MNWIRNLDDSAPPAHTRMLVSDGETVTIAHYIESDNHRNWFFESQAFKDMNITWWHQLPELPFKIQHINTIVTQDPPKNDRNI